MKKLLGILVLGLLFCSNAFAGDYLMHHFKKKYSMIFGRTIRIATYDNNGIAFYFHSKFITEEQLRAAGKEHCRNNSKTLASEEYTDYGNRQHTVIFRCK